MHTLNALTTTILAVQGYPANLHSLAKAQMTAASLDGWQLDNHDVHRVAVVDQGKPNSIHTHVTVNTMGYSCRLLGDLVGYEYTCTCS